MKRTPLSVLPAALLLGLLAGDATAQEPAAEEPDPELATVVPGPWLWNRNSVALAYGPLGLLGTSRLQIRGPMGRSSSIVFQDTYAGAGMAMAISPAFIEVGPRFSLAPIDVFDIDVQLSYIYTWRSSAGLLPYTGLTGTLDNARTAIKTTAVAGSKFTASISPTVKFKAGPVIGLWNLEWAFIHHIKPDGVTSPYVYEALRDLVIAWDDLVVTNIAAILVEIFDGTGPNGGPGPKFRVGPIMRDKQSLVSRDISTALGGAITLRPGPKPGWPDILVAVMGYLRDNDRQFKAPNIQVQLAWVLEKDLGAKRVADDVKTALR